MKLRYEIEAILRAILYPNSTISLVCKDEAEAKNVMNDFKRLIESHIILEPEIDLDVNSANEIAFKNSSYIKILQQKEKSNVVRGHRAEFTHWDLIMNHLLIWKKWIRCWNRFARNRKNKIEHLFY